MSYKAADIRPIGSAPARPLSRGVMDAFPGAPRLAIDPASFARVTYAPGDVSAVARRVIDDLATFLQQTKLAGFEGILVGLSGGIDSLVCAELCRLAAGSAMQVLTATIRLGALTADRCEQMRKLSNALNLRHVELDGTRVHEALGLAWRESGLWSDINVETRAIQALLFQVADSRSMVVCATTDRSEQILGRFTEAFYGHVAPLANLYKTQVVELAQVLGIAHMLADQRPGCDGHWYDDEVIGADYSVIDPLLHLLVSEGLTPEEICRRYDVADAEWIERLRLRTLSQHLRISTRTFANMDALP